jgi:hypothetical protein
MVLALLYLTLHDDYRAWKGFDWAVLNRLFEKELIEDPKNKNKSIVFTDQGLAKAEQLFNRHFVKKPGRLGEVDPSRVRNRL